MTTFINTFSEASKQLRPSSLSGVSSPYYVAASYCLENGLYEEAIELLTYIPKDHWQFEIAIDLKDAIYKKQINELKNENLRLKLNLADLNFHSLSTSSTTTPVQTSN